jgi:hypothetical protein
MPLLGHENSKILVLKAYLNHIMSYKLLGHNMFAEYLEKLRSTGGRYFTSQRIIKDLKLSNNAARSGLYRLK